MDCCVHLLTLLKAVCECLNPPAVVVESCLLLSFSHSSSVAVGSCYNQLIVSCKLNNVSNGIRSIDPYANWPKSLLSLQVIGVSAAHASSMEEHSAFLD